jgi:hypothetical protein
MNFNQRQQAVVELLAAGNLQAARSQAVMNEAILQDEIAQFHHEVAVIRFLHYFQPSSAFIN